LRRRDNKATIVYPPNAVIAALTPIRVLLASIALFVLGLVGGFALRTVLD